MPDGKKKARMFSKKASFLKSLYSLENIRIRMKAVEFYREKCDCSPKLAGEHNAWLSCKTNISIQGNATFYFMFQDGKSSSFDTCASAIEHACIIKLKKFKSFSFI